MSFYQSVYRLLARPLRAMFRVQVTGIEKLPQERGCILCANHTGNLDVLVISAGLNRQVRYMAKKELFRIPLLGSLVAALGAYPVDRGGADVASIRKTLRLLEEGELVGIFPQGTRYSGVDPKTTKLKHGAGMIAYHAKCDVVPVYLKTKKNKVRFFHKTQLIVGDVIPYEELGFEKGGTKEYKAATEKIFAAVCALNDVTDKAGEMRP